MKIATTPKSGSEKETLHAFLQQNRDVLIWKAEGISDEVARATPFASDLSLIGVFQHLACVETSWFREIFANHDIDYLRDFNFDFEADIDTEWHLAGNETLAGAIAMYTAAVDAANEVINTNEPDAMSIQERGDTRFSLRWTMIHMIEETARHTGQVDVLLEHLDGQIGYLPPLPS